MVEREGEAEENVRTPPPTHTHSKLSHSGEPPAPFTLSSMWAFQVLGAQSILHAVEYICSQINFYGSLDYDLTVSWNLVIREVLLGWI